MRAVRKQEQEQAQPLFPAIIAPMADIRRWRINTFPCSHQDCEARNSKQANKCKRCERPIEYDAKAKEAHSEEIKNPACLVACRGGCGEFVDGDAAFQPAEGEQELVSAVYFCDKCKIECAHCHQKLVMDSGPGAGKVCKECLEICTEKANTRHAAQENRSRCLAARVACGAPVDREEVRSWLNKFDGVCYSKLDEYEREQCVLRLSPRDSDAHHSPHHYGGLASAKSRSKLGPSSDDAKKKFRGVPFVLLRPNARTPRGFSEVEGRLAEAVRLGEVAASGVLVVKRELAKLFKALDARTVAGADEVEISQSYLVLTHVRIIAYHQMVRFYRNNGKITLGHRGRDFHAYDHLEDPVAFIAAVHERVRAYQEEGGFLSARERAERNGELAQFEKKKCRPISIFIRKGGSVSKRRGRSARRRSARGR